LKRAATAFRNPPRASFGGFVVACVTASWIGTVEVRADDMVNANRISSTSGSIVCASRIRKVDNPRNHSLPNDGRVVADLESGADIPIWKTITLGTFGDARALRQALKAARCRVGSLATEVLEQPEFTVANTRTQVSLTILSVADLGFGPAGASRAAIYRRAAQLSLGLCPIELAPQLRLQYRDQPIGEILHIAAEPIHTAAGDIVGFSVGNGGAGLFLVAGSAQRDLVVPSSVRFVFIRNPTGRMEATAAADRRTLEKNGQGPTGNRRHSMAATRH
jgi:hypothetical protein